MCSFTLGHWIIPFLSILVVQIGTMKCFYCPQKDASVVLWDSLSPDDQSTLMLVRGQFVTCVFALHDRACHRVPSDGLLQDSSGCRSEPQGLLHTHPAHSQMEMGSLYAVIFSGKLCLSNENHFSPQDK